MGTTIAAMADNEAQTVSIMTLNVDGLPRKVLFFDVNADGPGSAGSEVVSEYIASKNAEDMIPKLQENWLGQSGVAQLDIDMDTLNKINIADMCDAVAGKVEENNKAQ